VHDTYPDTIAFRRWDAPLLPLLSSLLRYQRFHYILILEIKSGAPDTVTLDAPLVSQPREKN